MSERKPLNFAQRLSRTRPVESEASSETEPPLQIAPPVESKPPSINEARSESAPPSILEAPVISTGTLPQNKAPSETGAPAKTEPTKGFLKLTNHFVYDLMPTLKPTDGYVLLYLIARTHGFGNPSIVVTQGTIANACHISDSQVRVCMKALAARRLIRYSIDRDNPNPLLRGYWVEMLIPPPPAKSEYKGASVSAPPSKSKPIKERTYERKSINTELPTPEDIKFYEEHSGRKWGE
jgi:hypothetical protein